ncbi:MAG: pyruvate dehydrogenase complex E1 component subunit beta [Paracoccaceae bacterium]|nr:pyruvate dehydrogenase complex E1 component subunit beta [Paracoccaceae bacterium]MYF45893.1 pyruvate dehydrogenase complex E1 component subunit beta [Paracoccaceae bacterium]MYI90632.1 pyruvate dehydrogenase complex E1 component subunit beta [Paracoccaceae bacterium]
MGSKILLPALSPTMEVGKIAKWFVKEGDTVASGDILAEIETDKAIMEFEAISDGVVEKLLVAENDEPIPVNSPIAIVSGDDDTLGEEETSSDENAPVGLEETTTVSAAPEAPREKLEEDLSLENVSFKSQTVREALRDAMAEEMERDELVFLMGEEVAEYQGAYKVSQGLLDQFGSERVIDTPITEHGFTGLGVGAGFAGLRPIVEFMTFNFAMQAIDHIINSAGKTLYMSGGQMNCPIVFRGPNGAAARVAAQHSQDYAAWYSHIPGLKVIQPFSAADAKGLLKSAIRDPNPVVFLENEILYNRSFDVPELDDYTVPIGKAKIWKEGKDITLVSFGIGMSHTLEAAKELENIGVDAEIIDLRTLRPLDKDTVIESVKKTNRCVTIEEGFPVCSIGNHLSYLIMQEAFDWLDAPIICCTGKDVPMPYAANLEKLALVSVPEIVQAAKSVLYLEE